MTKTFAVAAALVLSLTALPAAAECMGKGKPHDMSASTSTEKPVIRVPDANA